MLDNSAVVAWAPRLLSVLRIVTGYMFMLHGMSKLFGMPHVAMFDGLQVMSLMGFAGVLELVGGALLLLGLFTRPAAFIVSGEMAAAYFMGHASKGAALMPLMNQGEAAVLYCFIFLYLAFAGAGPWSVDAAIGKR
jgi:putative oxidoreductase